MEQIETVEQTRLPPPFTHSEANAARAKMCKSRLLKIGMTGHMFSEIFHPGDDRTIVPWQTGDDLSKVAVDASRPPNLKNPTIVENSHVTAMLVLI
jgi:hypothetical protein